MIICLFFLLIAGCLQALGEPLPQPGLFHPQPQPQQLVQQHFQLGVQRAREGMLQEAIDHLKYCLGLDPLFVDAYYILGLVYYHIGLSHLRETDYAMSKVLELQPGHVDALVYRGLTRMRLGAFAAAEGDFKTILSLAPETLPIRRDLANAYLRQGKIDAAIITYQKVIDADPDDLAARWNLRVAYAQQGGYASELPERYHISFPPHGTGASPVRFTDVAEALGVAAISRGRGSAWGDYDRDGDADLFTVGIRDPHHLYRHNGDGTFTEVTIEAGLMDPRGGWASLFFDYDRDGDSDLFVTRDGWRGVAPNSLYRNNGDGTFMDVTHAAGMARIYGAMAAQYGDIDNDGFLDIYLGTGAPPMDTYEPNKLLWNAGRADGYRY